MDNKEWKFIDTKKDNIKNEKAENIPVLSKQLSSTKKHKLSFIIVSLVIVVLICSSAYFGISSTNKDAKIQELQLIVDSEEKTIESDKKIYDRLKKNYQEAEEKYDALYLEHIALEGKYNFYYNSAACIDDNSKYYHHYGCKNFDASSYWIFNQEYADDEGYRPCPYCWR